MSTSLTIWWDIIFTCVYHFSDSLEQHFIVFGSIDKIYKMPKIFLKRSKYQTLSLNKINVIQNNNGNIHRRQVQEIRWTDENL